MTQLLGIAFIVNGAWILFATDGVMLDFAALSSFFGLCFFVLGIITAHSR